MKQVKCDICDHVAEGDNFEEWMKNLMPHYMNTHKDVMNDSSKTKEDGIKWMEENKKRFEES